MPRRGLSLIEVLVVIAIIALLFALLLPAIQAARLAALRIDCKARLRQIGIAVQNYTSAHGCLPPGDLDGPTGGVSHLVVLLPSLGYANEYNAINLQLRPLDAANNTVVSKSLDCYLCPADALPQRQQSGWGFTSYAGNGGSGDWNQPFDGLFQSTFKGAIFPKDIVDGASHTACYSEWVHGRSLNGSFEYHEGNDYAGVVFVVRGAPPSREEFQSICEHISPTVNNFVGPLGWRWVLGALGDSRYNHQLGPGGNHCMIAGSGPHAGDAFSAFSTGSRHPGGVNLLLADGAVRFISNRIDLETWRALGSRNGGELIDQGY